MPTVCVQDCEFDVANGKLGIKWPVAGAKAGYKHSDGRVSNLLYTPIATEWTSLADSWTNDTCLDHLIMITAHVGISGMGFGPTNDWTITHGIDYKVDGPTSGAMIADGQHRMNRDNGTTGYEAQDKTWAGFKRTVVPAGSTVNFRYAAWIKTDALNGTINGLAVLGIALEWIAWPLGKVYSS